MTSFCTAIPLESCGLRYSVTPEGQVISNIRAPRIMTPTKCADGYMRVSVRFLTGPKKMMAVHRLVAEAYCQNPSGHPMVNHIDGNKTNNKASNLEWVTAAGNMRHAVMTGLHRSPKMHGAANIKSVKELRDKGYTLQRIAEELGCSVATACRYAREEASG